MLIQGKDWESFCDTKFETCKQLLDYLMSKLDKEGRDNFVSVTKNDTNTDMTEETNPKILLTCTSSMTNSEKDDENHKTENKDKTMSKSEKHGMVTNITNKDENYINLPEQIDSNAVLMINNRLDIFEESLVKVTSTLANTIDISRTNHTDTLQELRKIKKIKRSMMWNERRLSV
ncbi:DNAI2 [Mytilus edulis]|uniref:DNAI2 n=1 Tax=Mytilus edulis TaxID=6550 RepID=A0A8S3TC25_MYTED|nr:DNAI2 [Mytilus edulis]